jgi:hypothetical protein
VLERLSRGVREGRFCTGGRHLGCFTVWGSAARINPSEPPVPAPLRPALKLTLVCERGSRQTRKAKRRLPYVLFSENGVEPKNISDTSQKKYQLDYRG